MRTIRRVVKGSEREDIKVKLYKIMAKPLWVYGSET
jgi:hypothetical protein